MLQLLLFMDLLKHEMDPKHWISCVILLFIDFSNCHRVLLTSSFRILVQHFCQLWNEIVLGDGAAAAAGQGDMLAFVQVTKFIQNVAGVYNYLFLGRFSREKGKT